jgi:hypothetical protein
VDYNVPSRAKLAASRVLHSIAYRGYEEKAAQDILYHLYSIRMGLALGRVFPSPPALLGMLSGVGSKIIG